MRMNIARCALAALVLGCATAPAVTRTTFTAPPQSALDTVTVSFQRAWATNGMVEVDCVVKNAARAEMNIDLRQWSLRMADMQLVASDPEDITTATPVSLQPDDSRAVHLRFPILAANGTTLHDFELVVGGVEAPPGSKPHVMGSIPVQAVPSPTPSN